MAMFVSEKIYEKIMDTLKESNGVGLTVSQLTEKMNMHTPEHISNAILFMELENSVEISREHTQLVISLPKPHRVSFLRGIPKGTLKKPRRCFWKGIPFSRHEICAILEGRKTTTLRSLWIDFLPYHREIIVAGMIGDGITPAVAMAEGYSSREELLTHLSVVGVALPCKLYLYRLDCPFPRDWAGPD